jgi:hypothetical protein
MAEKKPEVPVDTERRPVRMSEPGGSIADIGEDLVYDNGRYYMERKVSKAGAGRGFINPPIPKTAKYAKGGVTRADGCITKGHTRGKMV